MKYLSGVESNFGVKMWAIFPSIHTKSGHILETTKYINFHSACIGGNSHQV